VFNSSWTTTWRRRRWRNLTVVSNFKKIYLNCIHVAMFWGWIFWRSVCKKKREENIELNWILTFLQGSPCFEWKKNAQFSLMLYTTVVMWIRWSINWNLSCDCMKRDYHELQGIEYFNSFLVFFSLYSRISKICFFILVHLSLWWEEQDKKIEICFFSSVERRRLIFRLFFFFTVCAHFSRSI
jgi:hypothetical protein